jgi:hypothetical protein
MRIACALRLKEENLCKDEIQDKILGIVRRNANSVEDRFVKVMAATTLRKVDPVNLKNFFEKAVKENWVGCNRVNDAFREHYVKKNHHPVLENRQGLSKCQRDFDFT